MNKLDFFLFLIIEVFPMCCVVGDAAISGHPWKRQRKKKAVSALRNLSHLIHITGTVGSYS